MKARPTADYPVQVRRQEWEEQESTAALYAGIIVVTLNHHVDIAFIPDVSGSAPPWDDRLLPADLDRIETPEQARLATALLSSYVVTPNGARAGRDEAVAGPGQGPAGPRAVYYVVAAEFQGYTADLAELTTVAGALRAGPPVSELGDHPVIDFIARRVVASPHLDPRHAALLAR